LRDARFISRVGDVIVRRPRAWGQLRASLVAGVVAIATILALIASYVRAPEAVLAVAFARACAAEAAVTESSQPRLREDREEVHVDDVDAVPSVDFSKLVKLQRPRDGVASPPLATLSGGLAMTAPVNIEVGSGLEWLPVGPPTRERARLMVFLN
jgi:hypothetical protein